MKRVLATLGVAVVLAGVLPLASARADDTPVPPDTLLPLEGSTTGPTDTVAVVQTPGQPTITGPSVTVEPTVVTPGQRADIMISGFQARLVTISVCGNEARRGSADCNMAQSQGFSVDPGLRDGIRMIINAPEATCPCVIRVTSDGNGEIAATPITITGHAVGPIVDPASFGDLVAVDVHASEAPGSLMGFFRAGLGGRTAYDVTLSVRNLTTTTMHSLKVSAAYGHGDNDYLGTVTFGVPGDLPPGQTWRQTVRATVDSPAFGTLKWRATVSGAGPSVTAHHTVEHRPVLLMLGTMLAIIGVFTLLIRRRVKRHIAREQALLGDTDGHQPGTIAGAVDATASESPELVLTGG